ncbi:MAG TPA: MlaD family protein [Verrucomicrobiae bacterium]|nr:MlaD family protein [Verrucomicrobiae bacterium]
MKNSLETKLGIFVVLTVFAAIFIMEMLGGADFFQHGVRVNALFDTAQDLKVGDSVKMAGVEIGKVEKISLADQKVRVTMKLHARSAVKTDSVATIKFTGLMGQNFVAVNFGSAGAPVAVDGAVLETQEQPDLNAIMSKLDNAATGIQNITKTFTGDKIDNLLGPLTDFIKQNSAPISATIANVKNISGQISAGQGTIGKLIYDQALYNSAISTVTNLQDTIAQARGVVSGVSAGRGTLGKLVTDDALYNATTASMTNLNQVLQKVNQGKGTVGKLVNDQEFYKNAKLSLQKLDKAADSLEDTGPLSVVGQIAGTLF